MPDAFSLDQLAGTISGYKLARAEAKRLKAEAEAWETAAKEMGEVIQKTLESNEIEPDSEGRQKWVGTVNGQPIMRLSKYRRTDFDVKGFRSDHPAMADKYTRKSVQARLTLIEEKDA